MNVPQQDLNEMAEKAQRVNGHLLRVKDYLRRTEAPADVQETLETARRSNVTVLHSLVRAGADDPLEARQEERRQQLRAADDRMPEPQQVPLELLSSPAARRYAEAIRAAAVACREMETERNGPQCDGLAEILEDFAEGAEFEVYGPKGLQGG